MAASGAQVSAYYVSFSTGSAGLIRTISMFANHKWVAAVFGTVATVGWTIQGLGNAYYYRQVSRLLFSNQRTRFGAYFHGYTALDLCSSHSRGPHNGKGEFMFLSSALPSSNDNRRRRRNWLPMEQKRTLHGADILTFSMTFWAITVFLCNGAVLDKMNF
jgi:hypothetical protein